ncbi:MAG: hypothetical protein ACYTEK_14105 [Planctomycetota bacterium]|jgi:hypothetical protein
MGNISYRLGMKMSVRKMSVSEARNTLDNEYALDSFDRMVEHLKVNEVDLEKELITMGPMLTMDPEKERFVGEYSEWANMYVKRNYREPFIVPDKV